MDVGGQNEPFLSPKPPHLLFPGGRALSLGTARSMTRWENSSVGSPNTSSLLSLTGSCTRSRPCQNISQESLLTHVKTRGGSGRAAARRSAGVPVFAAGLRVTRGHVHPLPAALSQRHVQDGSNCHRYQLFGLFIFKTLVSATS